ncbi:helix-turn-helix domain-containing protein [Micromonospora sp. DT233]|uniref:helix-turn-helix domain-containing protein n=1 Tax=Micromonospora sp. DT233 TaxID=3393432 RepID=UPI003CEF8532
MSGPGRGINELPLGRRIAQWRVRRNMTQQQFADQIGKSKSWVDKVERGVRRLERVSNLRAVAATLRIDLGALLAGRPGRPDASAAGLEGVRAALARYHVEAPARPLDVAEQRGRLDHAEQAYRHARYRELLDLLPGLLDAARAARATRPGRAADELLVDAYGLVALALLKVDQGELAWLAADRGMAVAASTNDPTVLAVATVPLAQALRAGGRRQSALQAAVVAADQNTPARPGVDVPPDPALLGTLLVQAALAAAGRGDGRVQELFDRAARLAEEAGEGSAAVEAARLVAEAGLGTVAAATVRHERLTAGDGWRWLPPEHRAAYLVDAARAYARAGDTLRAGRALLDAERIARGEVHDRPAVRDLVAVVARSSAAPAGLARLAATLRVA